MRVVVIEPPQSVVSVEEAKKHLLVDHADDDALIGTLIAAATAWIDGPAGWLGISIGVQVLEARLPGFRFQNRCQPLAYGPLLGVQSVTYIDRMGVTQTVSAANYVVTNSGLWWRPPFSAPELADIPEPVTIRYRAGYGALAPNSTTVWANNTPPPIKVAILMMVAQWYRTREPVAIGAAVETLPFAVEALLSPYRCYQ